MVSDCVVKSQVTRNVVCTKTGKTNPSEIVVVGAHFDSISSATEASQQHSHQVRLTTARVQPPS